MGTSGVKLKGGVGEKLVGPGYFPSRPTKTQSLQLGEKVVGENNCGQMAELPSPPMC